MIVIFVSSFSKTGIASLLHLFRRAKVRISERKNKLDWFFLSEREYLNDLVVKVRINERNTKLNERKQKKNTWVFFCWTRQRQGSVPFLYNKCTNLCTNPLCSSYESQRITLLKVYIPFLGNNIDIYPHLLPLFWLSPLVLHPTGSSPSKSGQLESAKTIHKTGHTHSVYKHYRHYLRPTYYIFTPIHYLCHTKRKLFLPASRNTYPCKDSAFSLQGENETNKANFAIFFSALVLPQ